MRHWCSGGCNHTATASSTHWVGDVHADRFRGTAGAEREILITEGAGFGRVSPDRRCLHRRRAKVYILDGPSRVRQWMGHRRCTSFTTAFSSADVLGALIAGRPRLSPGRGGQGGALCGRPFQVLNVSVNGTERARLALKHEKRVVFSSTSIWPESQDPLERGRRPRPRLHAHRPLVLFDLEGGERALLLRLREDRAPHHGAALLQRLRAAPRCHRRGAGDHDLPRTGPTQRAGDGGGQRDPNALLRPGRRGGGAVEMERGGGNPGIFSMGNDRGQRPAISAGGSSPSPARAPGIGTSIGGVPVSYRDILSAFPASPQ